MKIYQIFVKHIFQQEWSYRGIFCSDSFDEMINNARECVSLYYENLADEYEFINLKNENFPCDKIDSYIDSIMEYKIVELEGETL